MATITLTKVAPSSVFVMDADGDAQVIISSDSVFTGLAVFRMEVETATPGTYIPIPDTQTVVPYARIYTFKAGNIRLSLVGADSDNTVTIDINQ
jgi:hypothetical protein